MRAHLRWAFFVMAIGLVSTGCDLNPQPEVPGADETNDPGNDNGPGTGTPPAPAEDDPALRGDYDDEPADPTAEGNQKNSGAFAGGGPNQKVPPGYDEPQAPTRDGGVIRDNDGGTLPPVVVQ